MMAIASPPLPQMRAASVDIFLAGSIWNSLLQIFKSSYKEVHTLWKHVFFPYSGGSEVYVSDAVPSKECDVI